MKTTASQSPRRSRGPRTRRPSKQRLPLLRSRAPTIESELPPAYVFLVSDVDSCYPLGAVLGLMQDDAAGA